MYGDNGIQSRIEKDVGYCRLELRAHKVYYYLRRTSSSIGKDLDLFDVSVAVVFSNRCCQQ